MYLLKITNIVKPAPIEALKAFKVFVKLSQVVTSWHKLPKVATGCQKLPKVVTSCQHCWHCWHCWLLSLMVAFDNRHCHLLTCGAGKNWIYMLRGNFNTKNAVSGKLLTFYRSSYIALCKTWSPRQHLYQETLSSAVCTEGRTFFSSNRSCKWMCIYSGI